MGDLGDLSGFMKDGNDADTGVGDREWLSVDPVQYREEDVLPKQNLDTVPDLNAAWAHEDKPSTTYLIPNTGAIIPGATAPNTMGDLSDAHGPVRGGPAGDLHRDSIIRTARVAIMQSTDSSRFQATMLARYSRDDLKQARTDLAGVLAERGLLGRLYLNAADFSDCQNTNSKTTGEFVRKYANDTRYVIAKEACGDCVHCQKQADGAAHCGVFKKEIKLEVPYTEELAEQVEKSQAASGKQVQASTGVDPKERIRQAYLAPQMKRDKQFTGHHQENPNVKLASGTRDPETMLIAVDNLTKKRDFNAAEMQARPIIALLRREMLKNRSKEELLGALRLSFDVRDLRATRAQWEPLFKEAGLYGTIYTTQDSFDDCKVGADFLARHGSKIRAVVAGSKCPSCIFSKVGRCLMYGKKLVSSAAEILTPETVRAVVDEHKMAGTLHYTVDKVNWGDTPVEALRALYKEASGPQGAVVGDSRAVIERAFVGAEPQRGTSDLTKRDIVRQAGRYMNEGLYGDQLLAILKSRFDVRDLKATETELRIALGEQGLQGIYYIDPTIYDDYGKGCKEAARLHRSRLVKYVKLGSKCSSCVYRTMPTVCSVINKTLVVEPPYVDKTAQQQEILKSGDSMEVGYNSLMNNGLTMMEEYQLQASDGEIVFNPETPREDLSIEFGAHKLEL